VINRGHRFHGYNSLRYVYQNGKTVRGPLTAMKYTDNPRRTSYRLAIVVSRKVSKSAVVRNRIRRRLYESVRLLEDRLTDPYDIVITVFHEQLAELPAREVERLVRAQLKQAGILKPKSSPREVKP
jgi:ribonuclease P protein component